MKIRRIVGSLDGAASSWYQNQRLVGNKLTWKAFKGALINRFTNSLDDYMLTENLLRTKQKANDFDSYWEEKMGLIKLSSPEMKEKELMHHMFDGLTKELRNQVMGILPFRSCDTAEQLKMLIKELQDIDSYKKADGGSNPMRHKRYPSGAYVEEGESKKAEEINKLSSEIRRLKKELAELSKASKADDPENETESEDEKDGKDGQNDEEVNECLQCGILGHQSWECEQEIETDEEVVREEETYE